MNTTVYDLWKSILTYGENTRVKNLDGLKSWNRMKDILNQNIIMGKWKIEAYDLYDNIIDLGLVDKQPKNMTHETWEKNHFYIQHGRIPKNNKMEPTLTRLLQIAYNGGLLKQVMITENDKIYNDNMKDFYLSNNLDEAETYMEKCVLELMSKEITKNLANKVNELNENLLADEYSPDPVYTDTKTETSEIRQQFGGNNDYYKNKYEKYKAKYLKFKKM